MANDAHVNVGKPPFFEGSNYAYWKARMIVYLKAMAGKLWDIVDKDYAIIDPTNLTDVDSDNTLANAQTMNVFLW